MRQLETEDINAYQNVFTFNVQTLELSEGMFFCSGDLMKETFKNSYFPTYGEKNSEEERFK